MIAISSPADEFNYYSMLLELRRPDGSFLFKQFRIGLACEPCMNSGKAALCTHMSHIMPHWLSVERSELARCLYGDNTAGYEKEGLGIISSSNVYVFNRRLIEALRIRKRIRITDPLSVREIHIGIDPHGGGEASECAIF